MNDGQKRIDHWFKTKDWSYWSPHENLARLVEEVGELARLINHEYGPKQKKPDEAEQLLEGEIGDILYTLSCLANAQDIDLDTALQKSIAKVESRDKNRY
jgi:NTP pyrophosphatase (non-canonical NTP hydrolase)